MLEMAFNGFLALLFLFFMIAGAQIPRLSRPADVVEAGGFPITFAAIGLLLLIAEVISQIRKAKSAPERSAVKTVSMRGITGLLAVVAMTIAYIALVKNIGFVVMTIMYVFLAMNILQSKRQWFNALFALIATVVLVIVFGRFFSITLPRGSGILKTLSFYLY